MKVQRTNRKKHCWFGGKNVDAAGVGAVAAVAAAQ